MTTGKTTVPLQAAERLRAALSHSSPISISPSLALADLDAALAAERRATVDHISERLEGLTSGISAKRWREIRAILDEEAAR